MVLAVSAAATAAADFVFEKAVMTAAEVIAAASQPSKQSFERSCVFKICASIQAMRWPCGLYKYGHPATT